MAEVYVGLIDVVLADLIYRFSELVVYRLDFWEVEVYFGPSFECFLAFLCDFFFVEVAPDSEHDVVGSEIFFVEFDEIVACDALYRCVFLVACVNALAARLGCETWGFWKALF